jgi:cytochrome P450
MADDLGAVDLGTVDFISDPTFVDNPYPYYEYLRGKGAVWPAPGRPGVMIVSGLDELVEIARHPDVFSSYNATTGPMVPLPFTPTGDDISEQMEPYRAQMPFSEHLIVKDPPQHTPYRALLARLFNPKRLQENEAYMLVAVDELIDGFIGDGAVEIVSQFSRPFTAMVITDLLGAPREMQEEFLKGWKRPGAIGNKAPPNPMAFLDEYFTGFIEERRKSPRGDVMSDLAQATFPDGSLPTVTDLVRLSTILYAAGQDTTTHFITWSARLLAERPDVQQRLRADPSLVPEFVEEMLRFEPPVRCDFRLVKTSTKLGGLDLAAGTTLIMLLGAANRDPRKFDHPDDFDLDRPNKRDHVAFLRGPHTCIGSPLARVETRTAVERLVARMSDIRISEAHHGPPGHRRYACDPVFTVRGLTDLHLEFTPA